MSPVELVAGVVIAGVAIAVMVKSLPDLRRGLTQQAFDSSARRPRLALGPILVFVVGLFVFSGMNPVLLRVLMLGALVGLMARLRSRSD